MPKTKIETQRQFMREYRQIQLKTAWKLNRIAVEAQIVPETLRKIVDQITLTPGKPVCEKLATLSDRVRKMQ